jgi:predicted nucleic acid-binding protein
LSDHGFTLDSGALIAWERGNRGAVALLSRILANGRTLAVPAGVVAQVWRDGRKQARLARLLASRVVEIVVLDEDEAREAGQLCGATGTRDVIDASVVLCARRRGHAVLTSDPKDLRRLEKRVRLVVV